MLLFDGGPVHSFRSVQKRPYVQVRLFEVHRAHGLFASHDSLTWEHSLQACSFLPRLAFGGRGRSPLEEQVLECRLALSTRLNVRTQKGQPWWCEVVLGARVVDILGVFDAQRRLHKSLVPREADGAFTVQSDTG